MGAVAGASNGLRPARSLASSPVPRHYRHPGLRARRSRDEAERNPSAILRRIPGPRVKPGVTNGGGRGGGPVCVPRGAQRHRPTPPLSPRPERSGEPGPRPALPIRGPGPRVKPGVTNGGGRGGGPVCVPRGAQRHRPTPPLSPRPERGGEPGPRPALPIRGPGPRVKPGVTNGGGRGGGPVCVPRGAQRHRPTPPLSPRPERGGEPGPRPALPIRGPGPRVKPGVTNGGGRGGGPVCVPRGAQRHRPTPPLSPRPERGGEPGPRPALPIRGPGPRVKPGVTNGGGRGGGPVCVPRGAQRHRPTPPLSPRPERGGEPGPRPALPIRGPGPRVKPGVTVGAVAGAVAGEARFASRAERSVIARPRHCHPGRSAAESRGPGRPSRSVALGPGSSPG